MHVPYVISTTTMIAGPITRRRMVRLRRRIMANGLIGSDLHGLRQEDLMFRGRLQDRITPMRRHIATFLHPIRIGLCLVNRRSLQVPLFLRRGVHGVLTCPLLQDRHCVPTARRIGCRILSLSLNGLNLGDERIRYGRGHSSVAGRECSVFSGMRGD